RTTETGTRIPARSCAKGAIITFGDVPQYPGCKFRVQQRVEESAGRTQSLVDPGDQACPQRSGGAGAADGVETFSITMHHAHRRVRIGDASDIRDPTPAYPLLPVRLGEYYTDPAATRPIVL